jgi:hypothetical protein
MMNPKKLALIMIAAFAALSFTEIVISHSQAESDCAASKGFASCAKLLAD